MGLSCGARLLKFLLFVFNLLFMLCGIACVFIGIFMILNRYAVEGLANAALRSGSEHKSDALMDLATKPSIVRQIGYAFVIVGLAILVISFMGCCGAAKEWRPLLCCYATLLMLILAIEISFLIYGAVHSNSFKKDLRQLLQESLKLYNGTDSIRRSNKDNNMVTIKHAWDNFMIETKCCGIDSKRGEFLNSPWYELTGKSNEFPPACCPLRKNGQLMPMCPSISRYGEGCYKKITDSLAEVTGNFKLVAWIGAITSILQGCIEMYQFENQFWTSVLYGIFSFTIVLEIVCIVISIFLFVKIKSELLYLYD